MTRREPQLSRCSLTRLAGIRMRRCTKLTKHARANSNFLFGDRFTEVDSNTMNPEETQKKASSVACLEMGSGN